MKVTNEAPARARLYVSDTGGNQILPNPADPPPAPDTVDVALDSDAFVPIAPPTSSGFIQSQHLETPDTEGGWEMYLDDAPTPGNVMVVGYTQRGWNGDIGGGGILVAGDGWTLIDVATCGPGNGGYAGMWYRVVEFGDVGHMSITKQASNAAGGWIAEFAMGALLDSVTDGPTGGSTTYTGPSITATGADQIAITNAIQSTNSTVINGDGTATVIAAENIAGGSVGPSYIGQYRIGGPGAEDFDASTSDAQQWGSVVALFDSVGTEDIQVPAPLTVDGNDATYEVSSLEEEVRLDIGNAQRLTSARLLIGFDTSGSKTVHLWASNDPDMAGAVDVTSEVFTATGGFTGDEVLFTIADTTAYRYWEFRGPVEDTRTYTVEMFAFQQSFDLSGYQLLSEKDDPNGYAGLTADGQVPDDEVADGGASDGDVPISNGDGTRTWGPMSGGGGTPSDTVSDETSFGITPDAGASTEYSRGDHTHGTPSSGSSGIEVEESGDSPITGVDHIVFADSGDATVAVVDDGGGQVTVTIGATGGGGADDPVFDIFGTPTGSAFEFDTSSLAGLTAQGSPDSEDADTTIPGCYFIADNAGGTAWCGRSISAPSAPFTVILKIADDSVRENYNGVAVFISETGPANLDCLEHAAGARALTVERFNNLSSFGGGIGTLGTDWEAPIFLAIRVTNSTTVDYLASNTGRIWFKTIATRNPGITIALTGFLFKSENTNGAAAALDFFRVWTSALTFPGV